LRIRIISESWGSTATIFPDEYRVEFGNMSKKKKGILPHVRVTSSMVWLVELAAEDIDELMPRIISFVPK